MACLQENKGRTPRHVRENCEQKEQGGGGETTTELGREHQQIGGTRTRLRTFVPDVCSRYGIC